MERCNCPICERHRWVKFANKRKQYTERKNSMYRKYGQLYYIDDFGKEQQYLPYYDGDLEIDYLGRDVSFAEFAKECVKKGVKNMNTIKELYDDTCYCDSLADFVATKR